LKKYILLSVGLCLFFLSSCKKDKDNFVPYELDGEISNLIDELLSESSSSFEVPSNTGHVITIDESSELRINEATLLTSNESDVALNWISTLSAVDMELLKLPNYSSGKYLKPIYTFQIQNSQEDNEIAISNQSPIELRIEAEEEEEAALFFLSNEGWSNMGDATLAYGEWSNDQGEGNVGYKAEITQNGWYSIATKEGLISETFSNLCIELPGEYTQGNTKSFVVLDNDVVISMGRRMEQGTFCTTMNIPDNQPIRIIVMSSLRIFKTHLYALESCLFILRYDRHFF